MISVPRTIHRLDSNHLSSLIQIIASMLKERSPLAIGSVAVAFDAVCPTRLDLLHQQYRRLCRMLPDADEWGQADLMNLLLRYARTMLPRPTGDELDPDVMLLLTSVEPILMSCNPAVSFLQSHYLTQSFDGLFPVSHSSSKSDLLCRTTSISTEDRPAISEASA